VNPAGVYPGHCSEVTSQGGSSVRCTPRSFFNQNLAKFQESYREYSIFSDRRADQKFAFDANFCCLQPSTVLRVFDGVILQYSPGARRKWGTGGVRTGVGTRQTVQIRANEDAGSSE